MTPIGFKPVVTGLGAISPLGHSVSECWQNAQRGHCAIKQEVIDPGTNGPPPFSILVARVPGNPAKCLEERLLRRVGDSLDPFAVFALAAAAEAIERAALSDLALSQAAVVFGHGMGGMHTLENGFERFYGRRTKHVHPLTVPRCMVSAAVSAITMEFDIRGPAFAVSSACASSGHAIAQGASLIASGLAEVAIVGGSEAIATPACLAAWDNLRAISSTACRPFSANRDGTAIGEGGAALVLESEAHARRRGAKILGIITGIGMSSDAHHITQPNKRGAVTSMRRACEQAGVIDQENLLISAHGTGTPLNDANENDAILEVFGTRTKTHQVIATKSAHGHLIGATTAMQAVLGLCSLEQRLAPPILNFTAADANCTLNLVTGEARNISCEAVLVNSFAFGGLNCSLVLTRDHS